MSIEQTSAEEKFLAPNPEAVNIALLSMLQARTAWDEHPEVGFIYNDDDGMVRTRAMNLSASTWERCGHPKFALRHLAQLLRAPRDPMEEATSKVMCSKAPATLCGMYCRSEGWTLPEKLIREYHDSGRAMPVMSTHPRRIEVRMANAVDSAGWAYWSEQRRGEKGTSIHYENELGDIDLGGEMFHPLRTIMQLLTRGARRRPAPPKGYVPPTFLSPGARG